MLASGVGHYGGMANRLKDATSPYLLQHADNPVDWWPWSDEAFEEARRRDVPVLLSVGYAACHWCHVMAHESFEDAAHGRADERATSSAIKVDREERPDVDAVYMTATQAMTGQGGWPMTVFLTPDREPVLLRHLLPARELRARRCRRQRLGHDGTRCRSRPATDRALASNAVGHRQALREAAGPLALLEDADDGRRSGPGRADRGRGHRPGRRVRRPTRRLRRGAEVPAVDGAGVPAAALRARPGTSRRTADGRADTCEAMARGGMYDQLGGGFARYSVDAAWVVPHFEKMLYDNALLARVYAHLWRRTGSELAPPGGRGDLRLA